MFSITRAFSPFLPGQTFAQEPHPVQSYADTVMENFIPGMPIMSIASIPSGAFASSSSDRATGRITACGHTYAQRLHWIQFSGFHIGISTAIPRFSYAEEPDGVEPSTYSLNADTGS